MCLSLATAIACLALVCSSSEAAGLLERLPQGYDAVEAPATPTNISVRMNVLQIQQISDKMYGQTF